MIKVGEFPEGVLYTLRNEALRTTSLYLGGELIGVVSDHQLMQMPRDGVSIDWKAWRAAKLTEVELYCKEEMT